VSVGWVLHNWTDAYAQASFDDVRRGVDPDLRRPHGLPGEAEEQLRLVAAKATDELLGDDPWEGRRRPPRPSSSDETLS
jgi:hypothetical protein